MTKNKPKLPFKMLISTRFALAQLTYLHIGVSELRTGKDCLGACFSEGLSST